MSSDGTSDVAARIRAGDSQAFEALHAQYWQGLVRSAMRYVNDAELAADVVQDIFVSLWIRRSTLVLRGSIAEYLYAAVRNQAVTAARHRHTITQFRDQGMTSTSSESLDASDTTLEFRELEQAIRRRFMELPARCRETFLLYRSGDLELGEVARIMGVSRATAKTQIKRAVAALRDVVTVHRR